MRKCLVVLVVLFGLGLPASAGAVVPPFQYMGPADGSTVQLAEHQNIAFEYACPQYPGGTKGTGYQVAVASDPTPNPEGKFATPFRIGTAFGRPINAEENICVAELSWALIPFESERTLFWRVERPPCEYLGSITAESCESQGPVWSFLLKPFVKPPVTTPTKPITTPTKPVATPTTPVTTPAPKLVHVLTYTGCGLSFKTRASNRCALGHPFGAFFKATQEVRYTVCVRFPNHSQQCARNQLAEARTTYVNSIKRVDEVGRYEITWRVKDHVFRRIVHLISTE